MQWIEQLQGQTVALDTAPLIYFIEQNPEYIEIVHSISLFTSAHSPH